MIEILSFSEALLQYQQHKISIRLLQDQAAILLGMCDNSHLVFSNPSEISQLDIDWLMQQSEAIQDYVNILGGNVFVCESAADLLHIHGCNFEWANTHNGCWPNVTDIAMTWDDCRYLNEAIGDPLWVIFILCWNNAGGPVYYVPRHLWAEARVKEHIAATNLIITT